MVFEMFKRVCGRIVTVQAFQRSHPEPAAGVFFNRSDCIITDAGRFIRIVPITKKRLSGGVEAVQTAAPGPDPQEAVLVLRDGEDTVMAERIGVIRIMLKDLEGVPVVAVQSIRCADPEEPPAILENGQSGVL